MWNAPWMVHAFHGSSGTLRLRETGLRKIVSDSRGGYYYPQGVYPSLQRQWAEGLDRLLSEIIDRRISAKEAADLLRAAYAIDKQQRGSRNLLEAVTAYLNNDFSQLPASTVRSGPEAIQDALESDLLNTFASAAKVYPLKEDRVVASTVTFVYE